MSQHDDVTMGDELIRQAMRLAGRIRECGLDARNGKHEKRVSRGSLSRNTIPFSYR